jgi:hypothetical protein
MPDVEVEPSNAIDDVLASVEKSAINDTARRQNLEAESKRMDSEAAYLQRLVHDNANPSPSVIVGCVFVVLAMLWLMYTFGFKPNASGEWYDDKNTQWIIEHDALSGNVSVVVNGEHSGQCQIVDNMFKCGKGVGLWNYQDTILLMNGGNLTRVRR